MISFALWTEKNFGKVPIDHALSTVIFSMRGAIEANSTFVFSFIKWCLFLPASLSVMLSYGFATTKFFRIHIPNRVVNQSIWRYFNIILLATGLILINNQFSIVKYIIYRHIYHEDYFAEQYVNPSQIKVSGKQPKSLVLIYVESLETTYSNTNIFGKDLLKRLTDIKMNHVSFSHYHQMPGTSWSIAGMIASQCAVPLKIGAAFTDTNFAEDIPHILANATCLGDILAAKGYKNIYMNGSRLSFVGVGRFLKDHHYTEMYGREQWLRSGILAKNEMTSWGLPDDKLLEVAKIRLEQLVKSNQPFNLTLFMIDTHGLSGELSQTCIKTGYADFAGIVECTANQLADFVQHAQNQGWLEKINIVIIGDHLAMKNDVSDKLSKADMRYIFNMIVSDSHLSKNTEEVVPFDMLPTILTSLGFEYPEGRLGLGYSALSYKNINRPQDRINTLADNLLFESDAYNKLWQNAR